MFLITSICCTELWDCTEICPICDYDTKKFHNLAPHQLFNSNVLFLKTKDLKGTKDIKISDEDTN